MTTQPREYNRPADWPSALAALDRPDRSAAPLVIAPRVPAEPYAGVNTVVDLSRLDLAQITQTGAIVALGVLVPLQNLVDGPWQHDPALHLLSQAAHLAAHPGLRHLASVGGVLSARSGPPEVLLALLALDARVVLRHYGPSERELPLADFLALAGTPAGEVVTAVKLARPSAQAAGGLARVARTPRDEAIVAAAAILVIEGDVCTRAALSLAGAGVAPQRATAAEAMLVGQTLSAALLAKAAEAAAAGLTFATDLRGSAAYRQAMAAVVARRSLTSAWDAWER
jgi:carbon-monoxide dehydrogenase medium subunit